jgi:pteridine reductase
VKVALVTGGHVRLGRAIAERLAAAHYSLAILYRTSIDAAHETARDLQTRYKVDVHLVAADLADAAAVHLATQDALDHFGGLDLLVNCASTFYPTRSLESAEVAWDHVQQVNLKAPFLMSVQCAPALRQRQGCIINLLDIYAQRSLKGYLPYSVAKAGLAALTHGLAVELAPDVRVNGVSPGVILPPPGQSVDSERMQYLAGVTPLGRIGAAADVAEAVYYLATAPYVTGQIVAVDGGRSLVW